MNRTIWIGVVVVFLLVLVAVVAVFLMLGQSEPERANAGWTALRWWTAIRRSAPS